MTAKIDELPNYTIDTYGVVRNSRGLAKKQRVDKYGYSVVLLYAFGRQHSRFVHRLIALAFIPNPENKPTVNHLNGIRADNRLENLEWCTHKENTIHGHNRRRS